MQWYLMRCFCHVWNTFGTPKSLVSILCGPPLIVCFLEHVGLQLGITKSQGSKGLRGEECTCITVGIPNRMFLWAILHGLASGFWGPPTGIAKSRNSEVDLQQNWDASNVQHLRHHLASFSPARGVEQAFARHPPSKSIFGPTPSTVNLSYKRRARGAVYYRVWS